MRPKMKNIHAGKKLYGIIRGSKTNTNICEPLFVSIPRFNGYISTSWNI